MLAEGRGSLNPHCSLSDLSLFPPSLVSSHHGLVSVPNTGPAGGSLPPSLREAGSFSLLRPAFKYFLLQEALPPGGITHCPPPVPGPARQSFTFHSLHHGLKSIYLLSYLLTCPPLQNVSSGREKALSVFFKVAFPVPRTGIGAQQGPHNHVSCKPMNACFHDFHFPRALTLTMVLSNQCLSCVGNEVAPQGSERIVSQE